MGLLVGAWLIYAFFHQDWITYEGHKSDITSLAFSADGRTIASADKNGTINFWQVPSSDQAPLSSYFPLVRKDGSLRLWSTPANSDRGTLKGRAVAFNKMRGGIVVIGSEKAMLSQIDVSDSGVKEGKQIGRPVALPSLQSVGSNVALSEDGLVLVCGDDVVTLWSNVVGERLATLSSASGPVALSADGRLLAAGESVAEPHRVRVWNMPDGEGARQLERRGLALPPSMTFSGHTGMVTALAFSPNSRLLASVGGKQDGPGEVKLWDLTTNAERLNIEGHSDRVLAVAFSPDGRRLASAGQDSLVKLWDVETGRQLVSLRGHSAWIQCLAFSPDGKLLAAAGAFDHRVKVWDVEGE